MADSFIEEKKGDNNKTENNLGDKSKGNDSDKCKTVSSSDKDNIIKELKENIHPDNLNQQNINNDTEEHIMMKAIADIEYADESLRIQNIFIAFKWLAELNGVLCNTAEPNISEYQIALKTSINKAIEFIHVYGMNNTNTFIINLNENHFMYLRAKRKAKVISFKTFFLYLL